MEREIEFQILQAVAASRRPLGSWGLKDVLTQAGTPVSEATAGRLLRELDQRGLTERQGFRGRRLTAAGQARLQALQEEKQSASAERAFMQTLRARSKEDLLEILEARRAIEGEVARLAAMRATPAQIQEMEALVDQHAAEVAARMTGWQEDLGFHRCLARAARNKVLYAASELVRQDGQLSPVLEHIRARVGGVMVADHRTILQKVKAKDAAGAEAAMGQHIDNLMRDVHRYWEKHQGDGSSD